MQRRPRELALRVAAAEKAEAPEHPTFYFMIRSVRGGGVMNGRRERLQLPPVASNLPGDVQARDAAVRPPQARTLRPTQRNVRRITAMPCMGAPRHGASMPARTVARCHRLRIARHPHRMGGAAARSADRNAPQGCSWRPLQNLCDFDWNGRNAAIRPPSQH